MTNLLNGIMMYVLIGIVSMLVYMIVTSIVVVNYAKSLKSNIDHNYRELWLTYVRGFMDGLTSQKGAAIFTILTWPISTPVAYIQFKRVSFQITKENLRRAIESD